MVPYLSAAVPPPTTINDIMESISLSPQIGVPSDTKVAFRHKQDNNWI